MSNKQIDITQKVMEHIHKKDIRMKPRYYFVFAAVLMFISMVLSIIGSVFLISLIRFSFRTHGPMAQYRLEQLLSSFPWWAPFLAAIGIGASIWLLKKYDFSYRHNFRLIIAGFIMALLVAVIVIEYFHLDNVWFRRGPMREMMNRYMQNSQEETQPNTKSWVNGAREGWGRQK